MAAAAVAEGVAPVVVAVVGAVVVAAEAGAGRNRQTTLNGPPMVTPIRFCHGQDHG